MSPRPLLSARFELASRFAAESHRYQLRKASTLPYIQHPFCVALILDRGGFSEDTVIAGLLHDVAEDTQATLDDIERHFGKVVRLLVDWCTERKLDDRGAKRPWRVRKDEQLKRLADAPIEAQAIVLADKLHNLISIRHDLKAGLPIWSRFNAGRDEWLQSYRAAIETVADSQRGDARLDRLIVECQGLLAEVENT